MEKLWRIVLVMLILGILGFIGTVVWVSKIFNDSSQTFVTGRPDLTQGGEAYWANAHAADYLPMKKAQNLRIALSQDVMAPAPDSLVAQFSVSPSELRNYLQGKKPRSESPDTILHEVAQYIRLTSLHDKLGWWPPRQTPTLKTYEATSKFGERFFAFVDTKSRIVTVIAPGNRGR
jgi:hypothetical protein